MSLTIFKHPGDPAANLNAAMACLRRGDLDRAERLYEEAADRGSDVAAADLERLRSDRSRQAVTIIQDDVESK